MKNWKLVAIATFFLVVVLAFFEYQIRQTIVLDGEIDSCRYQDAQRYCSLFTSVDGRQFLLTEGSVDDLKKIDEDISKFYKKPIKIKARISRQKIGVVGLGKVNRIEIMDFEI